jgi:hypothetical protein
MVCHSATSIQIITVWLSKVLLLLYWSLKYMMTAVEIYNTLLYLWCEVLPYIYKLADYLRYYSFGSMKSWSRMHHSCAPGVKSNDETLHFKSSTSPLVFTCDELGRTMSRCRANAQLYSRYIEHFVAVFVSDSMWLCFAFVTKKTFI